MANPQPDKFTKISNEIVDKFCQYRLSGEEWLVLWVILRKTYGWNKKVDNISLSQFCLMTGLNRSSVIRAIKRLVTKRILLGYQNATRFGNMYGFNKDYDSWVSVTKQQPRGFRGLPNGKSASYQMVNKGVTKQSHTKDNTKDTIQKKDIPPLLESIKVYFKELNKPLEADPFFDFYQSKGWKVGKAPMKDWKAAARNWCRRDFTKKEIPADYRPFEKEKEVKVDHSPEGKAKVSKLISKALKKEGR